MTLQWRWRSPAWFGGARRLLLIVGFDAANGRDLAASTQRVGGGRRLAEKRGGFREILSHRGETVAEIFRDAAHEEIGVGYAGAVRAFLALNQEIRIEDPLHHPCSRAEKRLNSTLRRW